MTETVEVLTTSQTWVAPGSGTYDVTVFAIGAGGGGGVTTFGEGGGGGGASSASVVSVTGGVSYNLTIPAGGAIGFTGGDTIFGSNLVVAKGGLGGNGGGSGGNGTGGQSASCTGTTCWSGGNVGAGQPTGNRYGGGGGSSGGSAANGNSGASGASGGAAGTAVTDGGAGGAGGTTGNGSAGSAPGGGGGGGGSGFNAGVGGRGQITLTYTVPPSLSTTKKAFATCIVPAAVMRL